MKSSLKQSIENLLEKYFSGSVMSYKQIFALIIPIFVDTSFIVLISILNTAMISSSGLAAVSAVSVVDSLNMFTVSIFIAIATGGTVIVAQYKGSRDRVQASKAATQSVSAVTCLAIVLCIIIITFHNPILDSLFGSADKEVLDKARIFLIGSCISYPFIALYQSVIGVLRGVGEAKVCLWLSVLLNLSYFVLNIILVTLCDLGVVGLSISLITARVLGSSAAIVYLIKYNHELQVKLKNLLHIQISLLKKIMYIGIPFAIEQLFFNGGKLLTQTFIVKFGTIAMSVNAISNSLSMLFQIGGTTLSVAIVTVVGQSMGRKDIADARKYVRSFIGLSTVFFVVFTIILLSIFPYLVSIYSPPDEIIPDIWALILLISIAQPLVWSISFILPSALRAAGDSKFTSITSLLTMWVLRITLGYFLGVTLNYGLMGVWIAMVIEWAARGIIFYLRFRGDKWYRHQLI